MTPDDASLRMTASPAPTRIALLGSLYPYRGGIAHFSNTMVRGLAARGHAVEAVTFSRQYPALLFPGSSQFETAGADPLPSRRLLDTLNPWTWRRTARHVERWGADLLVLHYWMSFFAPAFGYVARRVRRHGVRVLVVVHNALPHERRPGDVVLGRYALRAADACVVMSDAVARDLERLGVTAPVYRVAHPVYDLFGAPMPRAEARERLGLPPEAPVLLFFGFIRRYKGLHVLLESLPRVLAALPDVRLVVAGEFYEDEAVYREQIRAHGLERHVQVHAAYIPSEEVPVYFGAADVVVQPYVSATQSGVAQVAFHFDTPVIVTDVGGLAEVVPHEQAGLVVPPEDPEALAGAVVHFFKDHRAARLVEGVREAKRRYSWDRLYEIVEAVAGERTTEGRR